MVFIGRRPSQRPARRRGRLNGETPLLPGWERLMPTARTPGFYCGIDWSSTMNDVAVVDRHGVVVARDQIAATPHGVQRLFAVLNGLRNSHTHGRRQVPVAIETNQGLLVHALRAKGQPVYHIPPSVVVAERRRRSPAAKKSDRSDSEIIADILRDGWGRLRPLPEVTAPTTAITVLALAQRRAQRHRDQLQAKLRALLHQAHPAAVTAWAGLDHGLRRVEARAVLAAGPSAAHAQRLSAYRLSKILAKAGRIRLIDDEAYRLRDLFAAPVLRLPAPVEQALAVDVNAVLTMFDQACQLTDTLIAELGAAFQAHPYAGIYLSFPGCGVLTGARLHADLGDDPNRFATTAGLRAYAGLAPLTWESGSSRTVTHRHVCNRRLEATCHQWAFTSLTRSPGARTLYDERRAAGDSHAGALRRVAGRLISSLHHCLRHNDIYHERLAFPTRPARV
jgi:transposase